MNDTARIHVVTGSVRDAGVISDILAKEYADVAATTDPARLVEDLEKRKPDVLVLAFEELAESEHSYLCILASGATTHVLPPRTIVLCTKDDVDDAYELCCQGYFDDYVVFWPLAFDTWRLHMAVKTVLRDSGAYSVIGAVSRAKKIASLETILKDRVMEAADHPKRISISIDRAEDQIDTAIDNFAKFLARAQRTGAIKDMAGFHNAIDQLKTGEVREALRSVRDSLPPAQRWAEDLLEEASSHFETIRDLIAISKSVPKVVLVADDDVFQCRLIAQLLKDQEFDVVLATSGMGALTLSQRRQPDLFIIDVKMPDVDGIEVTRRLRRTPRFADTPVVIITGQSERNVVLKGREAGANDFIVKPFTKDLVLQKVRKLL